LKNEERVKLAEYQLRYEATVDLVQYFLPGFEKGAINGRVLARTTLLRNSLFICPATTEANDDIYNLLPIFYPDPFSYFVLRHRFDEKQLSEDMRVEINQKLGPSSNRQTSEGM
jgi:hypothetical protein